jgi:hypothetical protein
VTDHSSNSARPRRARPISRDLALEVAVRESAVGAEVQPVARFTEQQHNPWQNLPFTQLCRSTGVLESALLDALGGTPRPASPAPPETREPDDLSLPIIFAKPVEADDRLDLIPIPGASRKVGGEHGHVRLKIERVKPQGRGLLGRRAAGEQHRAAGEESAPGGSRCHGRLP